MVDDTTIAVYNAKVDDYRRMVVDQNESESLNRFMALLPSKAHLLDLGCGPGNSTALLQKHHFTVDAVDASEQMVAVAKEQFNVNARVGTFDDIQQVNEYSGVWANFSLLHASATEFPHILSALFTALKPGGVLHLGMKTGQGVHRDALGRLYTFYTEEELKQHVQTAGFTLHSSISGEERGLAGTLDPYMTLLSTKQT
jgi:trans-aconitate methyltransferase